MQELGVQKSPQGIAALSMGNPAPLQQRVQQAGKDPQTGLPKDLIDALALNIVTNEQDAAKREMALQQLQQAAGPTGQMPTVVQGLQSQAQQKLAAMQQHAIQQAQAQQAAQAQGIDRAPVEFQMAGGGIVAFAGEDGSVPKAEYETRYDRMNRENRERAAQEEADRIEEIRASGNEAGATTYGHQMSELGKAIDRAVPDPVRLLRKLVSDPSLEREEAEAKPIARGRPTMANDPRLAALSQPTPTMGGIRAGAPAARPSPATAGTKPGITAAAPAPAAPVDPMEAAYRKALEDMSLDRDARANAVKRRAMEEFGAPDTSTYDRLMAEYEDRKRKLNAPKEGWDAFMDYLGDISASGGRGRKWHEAGAQGAALNKQRQLEREAQQFDLTKQMLDVAQKKADTERAYKKELFGLGEAERAAVDKQVDAAVKEYGLDKRQAAELRNRLEAEHIRGKYSLQHAGITAAASQARGATLTPAQRASIADKAVDNVTAALNKDMRLQMQVAKDPALRQQLVAQETERLMAAAEGRTMSAAPGAASPGGTSPTGWGKASVVNP